MAMFCRASQFAFAVPVLLATVCKICVAQDRWVQLDEVPNTLVVALDKTTIEATDSTTFQVWVKWTYRRVHRPETGKAYLSSLDRVTVSCVKPIRYRVERGVKHAASGEVVDSYDFEGSSTGMTSVDPESIGEIAFTAACKWLKAHPDAVSVK